MTTKGKARQPGATGAGLENTHTSNSTQIPPKLKLTGSRNQCPTCGKGFNSVTAFEMHRVGKFGVDRRCATAQEMLEMGMILPAHGFWVTELRQSAFLSPDENAPRRLKKLDGCRHQ